MVTVDAVAVRDELRPLHEDLHRRGSSVGLDDHEPDYPPILSRDVLRRIAGDGGSREAMVPAEVCEVDKNRGFFGHQRVC